VIRPPESCKQYEFPRTRLAQDYRFINWLLLKVHVYMEQGDKLNMKVPRFLVNGKGTVAINNA
jgi:hypothetical protein